MPMSKSIVMPNQNALKFPAMSPDRTLSDAPPSRDDVTTSFTCADSVDVNTLTSSGMMAPARVPHVMMSESFHQRVSSPPSIGMSAAEATNVKITDTIEVIQTSDVNGPSKHIFDALA